MSLDFPILNWPQNKTIVLFNTVCKYIMITIYGEWHWQLCLILDDWC